jgi:hypothetical protein
MWGLFSLLLLCSLTSSDAVSLKVLGNFSETFFWFTTIQVGVKQEPFTVTIDTGSSDLLIPQLGCSSCFGGDPQHYYDMTGHLASCHEVKERNFNFSFFFLFFLALELSPAMRAKM